MSTASMIDATPTHSAMLYKALSQRVPIASVGSLPSSLLSSELEGDKGHFSPVQTSAIAESDQRLYFRMLSECFKAAQFEF